MDLHTTGGKNSDNNISAEFREQFGSTNTLEKSFSYKVVSRLSRQEGGNGNPYENGQQDSRRGEGGVEKVEPEEVTFGQFVR